MTDNVIHRKVFQDRLERKQFSEDKRGLSDIAIDYLKNNRDVTETDNTYSVFYCESKHHIPPTDPQDRQRDCYSAVIGSVGDFPMSEDLRVDLAWAYSKSVRIIDNPMAAIAVIFPVLDYIRILKEDDPEYYSRFRLYGGFSIDENGEFIKPDEFTLSIAVDIPDGGQHILVFATCKEDGEHPMLDHTD